jgi:hypothetical protein
MYIYNKIHLYFLLQGEKKWLTEKKTTALKAVSVLFLLPLALQ